MMRTMLVSVVALLLLSMEGGARYASQRSLARLVVQAEGGEGALPGRVLWVWERPEDLRGMDAATGVAVLRQTLRLGAGVTSIARRQPVVLPDGVRTIAVVRIETSSTFAAHRDDPALLAGALGALRQTAWQRGIGALQIDYDARRSERRFYRRLLTGLRREMPAGVPLEMTALVSWCSTDDWIGDLPVNAAIPMFFRLEPDRRRMPLGQAPEYRLREPLCAGAIGVSTTEPWPSEAGDGRRVFLFADNGWARDLGVVSPAFARSVEGGRR